MLHCECNVCSAEWEHFTFSEVFLPLNKNFNERVNTYNTEVKDKIKIWFKFSEIIGVCQKFDILL